MKQIKFKIVKRYVGKFFNFSFCIAGGLFFVIAFNVMTIIPKLNPNAINQLSRQNMLKSVQLSLSIWQFLFWLPITVGFMLTLVEGLASYFEHKQKLSRNNNS